MIGYMYEMMSAAPLCEEDVAVRALLRLADKTGEAQRAAFHADLADHADPEDQAAARTARDHGFSPDRLLAMKSLARARGVSLEFVLRAALRGELRRVVELPAPERSRRR